MPNATASNATASPPDAPLGLPISPRAAHLAQVHIGVTVPLLILATIIFSIRLYGRIQPRWRMEGAEWCMVAGFVLAIACYGLLMAQMILTPTLISFAEASNAIMLAYFAIPCWGWAMTFIKISVALSLLRIKYSTPWKIGLYAIVGVQTVWSVGTLIYFFLICHPLSDWWDITNPTPHCLDGNVIRIVSTTGSCINIVTDVLLSLSPVTFLWKLNRPVRERVLVCLLMGMGLFASISSIVKLCIVLNWVRQPADDLWSMAVSIATWTVTEEFFAIMAACLPYLKPLLQRCFGRIGFSVTKYHSEEMYTDGPRGRTFGLKPLPMSSGNEQSDESPAISCGHRDGLSPVHSNEDPEKSAASSCTSGNNGRRDLDSREEAV